MAQAESLHGADRIRSLTDKDSIYGAFDAYPWTKDTAFLAGLAAILGDPGSASQHPQASLSDMATYARIFYYSQRVDVQIDFASYQEWLTNHPDHTPPDVIPHASSISQDQPQVTESGNSSDSSFALPWQEAAPRADLFVKHAPSTSADSAGSDLNYPLAFSEMLKLLQEGKPIPGIRQIPNTLARDPSVKPIGSRPAPRKPWEKSPVSPTPDINLANALDQEFPPLDTDMPASPSTSA